MEKKALVREMKEIVNHLVNNNYAWVSANDHAHVFTPEEIARGVENHPGTLTMPPDSAFERMYTCESIDSWMRIDMYLWYDGKEGDMAIKCQIREDGGKMVFEMVDILVP